MKRGPVDTVELFVFRFFFSRHWKKKGTKMIKILCNLHFFLITFAFALDFQI